MHTEKNIIYSNVFWMRWLRLNSKIMTPEQPSNMPDIKDMNESTAEMAATPPMTYRAGKAS